MMQLCGIFLGIIVFFVVATVCEIVVGKIEGYYVYGFSFFWIHLKRDHVGEKLHKCMGSFSFFPRVMISKPNIDMAQDRKRVTKNIIVTGVALLVITAFVVWIFIIPNWGGGILSFQGSLWFLVTIFLLYFVCIDALRRQLSGPQADLAATGNKAMQDLRNGASFEQLVLPPDKLRRPHINDTTAIIYLQLCFMKALSLKDIGQMSDICRALDKLLMKESVITVLKTGTSHLEGAYSAVLLFSSYIRPHPENATKYYKLVGQSMEMDNDFNSRVVLAFYYFKILRRPDMAANFVSQAEAGIATSDPERFSRAEVNLYMRLIDELKNLLDMTSVPYNDEPRPVIAFDEQF